MAVNGVLFGCIASFYWYWMPHPMVKSWWWPWPWTNVVHTWTVRSCSLCTRSGSPALPLIQNAFLRSTWTEKSTELNAGCVYQGYVDCSSYQWGECGSCDHWSFQEMVFDSRWKCCMIRTLVSARTTSREVHFWVCRVVDLFRSVICIDWIRIWCID